MARKSGPRTLATRGFTLIELMVTLAVAAVIAATYQRWQLVEAAEEAVGQSTGQYINTIRGAVAQYQQDYFLQLANGSAVPGYANALAPTIAELKADGNRIPGGLPAKTPGGQSILIQLTRTGCPGTTCQVNGLVYMAAPFTLPRTGTTPRVDLALAAVAAMGGSGGLSTIATPGTIKGGAGSEPNPLGSVEGVVGAFTYLDNAFWLQFVRINDTRDPNLQGNLTVGGNGQINGTLTVNGATELKGKLDVTGGDIAATGRVVSKQGGCERVVLDPTGGSVSVRDGGCLSKIGLDASNSTISANNAAGSATVLAQGATGAILLRDGATTTRVRLDGASGLLDVNSSAGTSTVRVDGAAGRVTTQIASLTITAVANTACGAGFSNGDMVRDADASGTIVLCQAGVWRRPGLTPGTEGAGCPSDGMLGQDGTGIALICRSGAWVNLNNRVTRSVLMSRWLVLDGNSVPQPSCSGATPAILITPADTGADYAGTPPRNRFTATVSTSGSNWIVHLQLQDSSGVTYSNAFNGAAYNFQAIAQTFCDYSS